TRVASCAECNTQVWERVSECTRAGMDRRNSSGGRTEQVCEPEPADSCASTTDLGGNRTLQCAVVQQCTAHSREREHHGRLAISPIITRRMDDEPSCVSTGGSPMGSDFSRSVYFDAQQSVTNLGADRGCIYDRLGRGSILDKPATESAGASPTQGRRGLCNNNCGIASVAQPNMVAIASNTPERLHSGTEQLGGDTRDSYRRLAG
ncbi:hypothetical protein IWW41_005457, partial [Coemansia sp. RSA 2522]